MYIWAAFLRLYIFRKTIDIFLSTFLYISFLSFRIDFTVSGGNWFRKLL